MLFDPKLRSVERAMDGLSSRFQAASTNLANIHTPGYQRQVVDFERELADAVAAAETGINPENPIDGPIPDNSRRLEIWHPSRHVIENKMHRIDGNGVNLETEMATVTQTALDYNMMATYVASEYRPLKFVIDAR
jgi:flagellar basal-body rod protein FlgB